VDRLIARDELLRQRQRLLGAEAHGVQLRQVEHRVGAAFPEIGRRTAQHGHDDAGDAIGQQRGRRDRLARMLVQHPAVGMHEDQHVALGRLRGAQLLARGGVVRQQEVARALLRTEDDALQATGRDDIRAARIDAARG
jgi:hypothetical protein